MYLKCVFGQLEALPCAQHYKWDGVKCFSMRTFGTRQFSVYEGEEGLSLSDKGISNYL